MFASHGAAAAGKSLPAPSAMGEPVLDRDALADHEDGSPNASQSSGVDGDIRRGNFSYGPNNKLYQDAWRILRESVMYFDGKPVGTIAAQEHKVTPGADALNYDQCFVRDFFPSAIAFLMAGEHEIVRNFLLETLELQSWERPVDCFTPGEGLMPASFKVIHETLADGTVREVVEADFGELAIGRVAPVDSGLWWIILLRTYTEVTQDRTLADMAEFQKGMRLILKLCLNDVFDLFPTMLTSDGCCMIDRRMGIDGHPIEIQSLFYAALRCSYKLLKRTDGHAHLLSTIEKRMVALSSHVREHYFMDFKALNTIYRFKTEEYSDDALNQYNVYPDSIPDWIIDWMPPKGGFLIGNLGPARMDFRFFALGNLMAIICNLTTPQQADSIMALYEARWADLIGEMPLKIQYPALEGSEWRILTGADPKNTPWSYHNGGSWPTLLWAFSCAAVKVGRSDLALRAISVAEARISEDRWAEYYDGKRGQLVGKQSRLLQTWSVAGVIAARQFVENPANVNIFGFDLSVATASRTSRELSKNMKKRPPTPRTVVTPRSEATPPAGPLSGAVLRSGLSNMRLVTMGGMLGTGTSTATDSPVS